MGRVYEFGLEINSLAKRKVNTHWAARYKQNSQQANTIFWGLRAHQIPTDHKGKFEVTLSRHTFHPMDSDNLQFSLKAIRDAIADYLRPGLEPGHADNEKFITWTYLQPRGRVGHLDIKIILLD